MNDIVITTKRNHSALAHPSRTTARWMLTFAGFPLGGLAAMLTVGPVTSAASAVLGGLLTGLVLGAVQAWGLAVDRAAAIRWALGTAIGLGAGLSLGTTVFGYGVTGTDLIRLGAVCGLAVGAAQALVLRRRNLGVALAWPLVLAVFWAAGWAVTYAIGVDVDQHFTVFGSGGAVVVTAATTVLPLRLRRPSVSANHESHRPDSESAR
jgi:hypothetical protein